LSVVACDDIEGVLSLAFKLPGLTVDSSENSLLVLLPSFGSRVSVDSLVGD
jgi:hypothetical protein